jgi:hypothetical protein
MRTAYDQICPSCGHRPEGEGLLVAWLLSSDHLDDTGLDEVQKRVRSGEWIRPSGRLLDRARRALGAHFDTDRGLTSRERLALLATVFLVTPLVGWVLGAWWWNDRPRAAMQALALAVPATVLTTAAVIWLSAAAAG